MFSESHIPVSRHAPLSGTDQFCLSPVARNLPAFEISFLHQPFHMDGYQIRLDRGSLQYLRHFYTCGLFSGTSGYPGCLRNAGLHSITVPAQLIIDIQQFMYILNAYHAFYTSLSFLECSFLKYFNMKFLLLQA